MMVYRDPHCSQQALTALLLTRVQVACGSGLERICRFLQSDPCEAHLDHSPYVRKCRHVWAVDGCISRWLVSMLQRWQHP